MKKLTKKNVSLNAITAFQGCSCGGNNCTCIATAPTGTISMNFGDQSANYYSNKNKTK